MTDEKIIQYIQGKLSPEEKRKFLDWVDDSPIHKEYYRKIRELWDLSVISGEYGNTGNPKAYNRVKSRIRLERKAGFTDAAYRITTNILKIAAVVLVTFGVAWLMFDRPQTEPPVAYNDIEVPTGQRVKLNLSDGSVIWLNAGTRFSYPDRFSNSERTVFLNGEAHFNIARNEDHPFTVQTSTYSVKVLGTKFNVYAYDESQKFETTLFNGSVLLQKGDNPQNDIVLQPGQQAVFDKELFSMTVHNHADTTDINSWTAGYHVFNKTPFRDMVERLSHYYEKKIRVEYPAILDYECTGKFRHEESLGHILNVVKISKPFRYKTVKDEIVIY